MAELMKGHKWSEKKQKMTFPAWAEIKTDEIRVRVVVCPQTWTCTFLSYAEKPLHNLGQFAGSFVELAQATAVLEFDCGFEANGNFNDSYRFVRSSKGLPADLLGVPTQFLLFDLPESRGPFSMRMVERHSVAVLAAGLGMNLYQPHGEWVHSEEDVEAMFTAARAKGYEGLMVKDMQHLYQRGKRVAGWLKVKAEEDADGQIEGLCEAISEDGTPLGRAGSVHLRMEDGSRASPHGIAHALGRDMWENPAKYIGQWCEMNYMERDRQGGYRHPTFKRIREDKV